MHWRSIDLTNTAATERAFKEVQPELIFHLCSHAQGERDLPLVIQTFQNELTAAVNVLLAVTKIKCNRIIFPGSFEEPDPSDFALSPYAAAKAATRMYAQMFHVLYELPVVMTRIFMAYGPGQSQKKIIANCIASLRENRPMEIRNPNRQLDWIYIDDVIQGLVATMMTPGLEGNSVDIGSGKLVTIQNIVQQLQMLTGNFASVRFVNNPDISSDKIAAANLEKTESLTGWHPTVSLDKGLEKTVLFHSLSIKKNHEACHSERSTAESKNDTFMR